MAITISGSGITSANIADGTIVNADINSSAAIDGSKLTGAGKVLQVVQTTSTTGSTIVAGAGWTDVSGSTLTITPSSTSSKILITFNTGAYTNDASVQECGLRIDSSEDGVVSQMTRYFYDKTTLHSAAPVFYTYLDSPASTSAITYKLQALSSTSYWFINQGGGGTHSLRIIAMEIGA